MGGTGIANNGRTRVDPGIKYFILVYLHQTHQREFFVITCPTVRCRSFVWYLIIAFTICSIPHFELAPAELAGFLSSEAYAAQTDYASSCPAREYVHDALGRIATERQLLENGRVSETRYNYSGFSTTKTDPDGRVKTETGDYL